MTSDRRTETGLPVLEIGLDSCQLPVSYLSSLLRVVQAALREVARSADDTRQPFSQAPQPVLNLSAQVVGGDLVLRFSFADPLDSTPMPRLSERTFESFFEGFRQLLKGLPQPGLWGRSVGGAHRRRHDSEFARRMDEVRLELRRFRRARLCFRSHTILIEGDRVEIA